MKILVIRFYHLGDTILTSILCNSLKHSFKDAQVDYLTYAPFGELFEHNASIDTVISISQNERRKPLKYLQTAWKIAANKYDIIIDAQGSSKSGFISLFSVVIAQTVTTRVARNHGRGCAVSEAHRSKKSRSGNCAGTLPNP